MSDSQPTDEVERIRSKTLIYPPGVNAIERRNIRKAGPLRILWAARWEHDKNPEDFFEALKIIKAAGTDFRVSVIGEQFRQVPEVFGWARQHFVKHIDRWGYQGRSEYEQALKEADVFVSTANHEFSGISAVEAGLAGAYPILPKRLAYPEIMGLGKEDGIEEYLNDGAVADLSDRLIALAEHVEKGLLLKENTDRLVRLMERYKWDNLGRVLDQVLENIAE